MIDCPHCGEQVPDDANFCRGCGNSIAESCANCGESVTPDAEFCPSCGAELGTADTPATSDDTDVLQLRHQEFARQISGPDLKASGFLNRLRQKEQVKIEKGHQALILRNGSLKGTVGPGKHTIDSLGRKVANLRTGEDFSVVLISNSNSVVTLPIEGVQTASEYPVDVSIELVVSITEPERLFTTLMADQNTITTDDFERILGGAIRDELEATISQYDHEELYGNRAVKEKLLEGIINQAGQAFKRVGLKLVEISAFEYDDGRDEVRSGQKEVEIRAEKEEIADQRAELKRRERERDTDDTVHEQQERVREETTTQAADHEIETQQIEHEHERDDIQRRHKHEAEREHVEHGEHTKTRKKEGKVERRDLEHEQDMEEMEDLVDLKSKKDQRELDREEREKDLEMQKERHEAEVEKERLEARDSVDLDTLASMEDVDEAVTELAEIEKAEDLTPEQLEALGAQDSEELAKARQEAHKASKERERVKDQKEFREEMKDVMDDSMDRMQETTESAMDNMGETGKAAAEDTSDNVIVSGSDSSDNGDTTIVQGGGGGSGDDGDSERVRLCPNCDSEVSVDDDFCLSCGAEI